jgi:hypothetical protein
MVPVSTSLVSITMSLTSARFGSIEAKVFVGIGRAGDGCAEVGVPIADMDPGGVRAIDW